MGIEFEALKTVSLSRQIADKIREAILSGALEADERLPTEGELAQRFNVSRPTIREALKRLAAQNLVRSRRGPAGGTFVKRPTSPELSEALTSGMTLLVGMGEFELEEINQARRELESICCELAAENCGDEQYKVMQDELELQQRSDLTPEEFCASDVRFHRAIADATQNGVLRFVMFAVIEALQPVANMISFRYSEREVIVHQHQQLLDALRRRDKREAVMIIQQQIDYLQEQQLKERERKR